MAHTKLADSKLKSKEAAVADPRAPHLAADLPVNTGLPDMPAAPAHDEVQVPHILHRLPGPGAVQGMRGPGAPRAQRPPRPQGVPEAGHRHQRAAGGGAGAPRGRRGADVQLQRLAAHVPVPAVPGLRLPPRDRHPVKRPPGLLPQHLQQRASGALQPQLQAGQLVRRGLLSLGAPLPRLKLQPVGAVDSGVGVPEVKKEKVEEADCAVVGGIGGGSRPPRPRRSPGALVIRENSEQRNTRAATAVTGKGKGKVWEASDDGDGDGDGDGPSDLANLGSSKRPRSSYCRNGASSSGGANGAANVDAAAEAGPGTGGGTGAAGGWKLPEKVKPEPDPRGFSMLVAAGVENRKLEVARGISDGLNTWFAAEALREMSLSKEKWDPPLDVADPIEKAILERCYRRQLERHREDQEKEKEAATGDPALREEA